MTPADDSDPSQQAHSGSTIDQHLFLRFAMIDLIRNVYWSHQMSLVTLVVTLAVVGVLLWLVNLIPMQGTIKSILNAIVVIAVVIWLLKALNLLSYITQFRVGHS
jgi:hypothetical protein